MDEREQIEGRLQEQAAKEADRHTTPAREIAARLIAHANAVKARRPGAFVVNARLITQPIG